MSNIFLEDFNDSTLLDVMDSTGEKENEISTESIGGRSDYEDGYKAGWDDAANSYTQEKMELNSQIVRALQEISMTHSDARQHVVQTIQPFLNQIFEKMFPKLLNESLFSNILSEIEREIELFSDKPVRIMVSPGYKEIIQSIATSIDSTNFEILEEETVSPHQAYLCNLQQDRLIDVSTALDKITNSLKKTLEIGKDN